MMNSEENIEFQEARDEATFQQLWRLTSSLIEYVEKYEENFDRDKDRALAFIEAFKYHFNQIELDATKEKIKSQFLEEVNLEAHLFVYDITADKKHQITKRYNTLKNLILPNLSVILDGNTITNNYYKTDWFKVGVKFASGELNHLFNDAFDNHTKNKVNLTEEITRLNLPKNSRVYITPSILNNTDERCKNEKNIFLKKWRLDEIIKYCKNNKIKIQPWFINRYRDLITREIENTN